MTGDPISVILISELFDAMFTQRIFLLTLVYSYLHVVSALLNFYIITVIIKVDSEASDPDDSDDIARPKSRSGKPKKGKKPKVADKMTGDDDFPSEDDSVESDSPSDDPKDRLKGKKKPRKARGPPSKHDRDESPEDVSVIATVNSIYRYNSSIAFISNTAFSPSIFQN